MMTCEEMTWVVVEVIVMTHEVMIGKEVALVAQSMTRTAEFHLTWILMAVVIGPGCFEEPLPGHFQNLFHQSGGYSCKQNMH